MTEAYSPELILHSWARILGPQPEIVERFPGRDLWRIQASDMQHFYLKRYGPWRNLPLEDEARVLHYLASSGIGVAELLATDEGLPHAGSAEELLVLFPHLEAVTLNATETLASEKAVGRAMAELHGALASYVGPIDAYVENLKGDLQSDLMLPPSLAELFGPRRGEVVSLISPLSTQLIHGDMTPGNVILKNRGEVSGFIDFDHLPIGPRAWDAAKYLSRRLRRNWIRDDATASHDRTAHIAPFLQGYTEINPLNQVDLDALNGLILTANVIETSYFLQVSSGKLPRRILPDHDEVLKDSAEAAKWHLLNWDVMAEAVESA